MKRLTAHAWYVSNVRTRPPDRVLRLRDADVRKLAADSDQTPTELVGELHNRGMLTSE